MSPPVFRAVGDTGLLIGFGDAIDDAVFARVVALDRALAAAPLPGLIETVPAYASLLIVFDPVMTDHATITAAAQALLDRPARPTAVCPEHIVEVRYDGTAAPDLAEVADRLGLSAEAVVAAHLAGDYRVFMYGFAPGYAYLGGVPAALQLARKPAAVRGMPVGSVMIAGAQCLITTLPMPTGWWVIGRTRTKVLDAAADRPFRFAPGDRVRFVRAP